MSSRDNGGEFDGLAPVIPLFGRRASVTPSGDRDENPPAAQDDADDSRVSRARWATPDVDASGWARGADTADADAGNVDADAGAVADARAGAGTGADAVIRTDSDSAADADIDTDTDSDADADTDTDTDANAGLGVAETPGPVGTAGTARIRRLVPVIDPVDDAEPAEAAQDEVVAQASQLLLRRLRGRSLSVREARTLLVRQDLREDLAEGIIEEFLRLGYLDDAALAEQLVHAGIERRHEGRAAIAQSLSRRGVPREVADVALEAIPDDDMDRALEYARRKAGAVGGRDADASLRRLVGQLSRRGYPSGVAMSAARIALAEQQAGASRFDPSRPRRMPRFEDG